MVLHGGGTDGKRDIAEQPRGVHNRGLGPVEHGRKWGTPRVEQVKLVTVGGILEHSILLVKLSHVVVLDEVGDRLASVLNLLIPVAEGSERDGICGVIDGVCAVVPVQQPSDALVPCG